MKKWLIGSGIVGAVLLALLTGLLMTSVFAQGSTPAVPEQGSITAEEAKAAALAANPGTQVISVDQDNKDGTAVYEVTLDSSLEVQVDAGSGAILGTDQEEDGPGVDNVQEEAGAQDQDGDGDQDNVQEEFESQADDASEIPGVEDAPGQ